MNSLTLYVSKCKAWVGVPTFKRRKMQINATTPTQTKTGRWEGRKVFTHDQEPSLGGKQPWKKRIFWEAFVLCNLVKTYMNSIKDQRWDDRKIQWYENEDHRAKKTSCDDSVLLTELDTVRNGIDLLKIQLQILYLHGGKPLVYRLESSWRG